MPTGPYTTDTPHPDRDGRPCVWGLRPPPLPRGHGVLERGHLGDLRLTWYHNIDPEETVAIVNHLHTQAAAGEDGVLRHLHPRGKGRRPGQGGHRPLLLPGGPGGKVAFCNAGGGFAYVGAMQDSFPHALELSRRGYNAFALIYRPGAQTACEDLARAITFVSDPRPGTPGGPGGVLPLGRLRRGEDGGLAGVLWPGGLRRGRPAPGRAVIMQYTGHSDYTENDPPPSPAWGSGTASPTGGPWSAASRPCRPWASPRSSTTTPV